MAVTLDIFANKKEINAEVYDVKPVNVEPEQIKADRLIALTEKGKRLVKQLMLEGKLSMEPKPWWWDEV